MTRCEPEDCEFCNTVRVSPEYQAALMKALDSIPPSVMRRHWEASREAENRTDDNGPDRGDDRWALPGNGGIG